MRCQLGSTHPIVCVSKNRTRAACRRKGRLSKAAAHVSVPEGGRHRRRLPPRHRRLRRALGVQLGLPAADRRVCLQQVCGWLCVCVCVSVALLRIADLVANAVRCARPTLLLMQAGVCDSLPVWNYTLPRVLLRIADLDLQQLDSIARPQP
jgi:hypothetical protein